MGYTCNEVCGGSLFCLYTYRNRKLKSSGQVQDGLDVLEVNLGDSTLSRAGKHQVLCHSTPCERHYSGTRTGSGGSHPSFCNRKLFPPLTLN